MLVRRGTCLALITLLLVLSCARLEHRPEPTEGDIAVVEMPSPDSIPAAWGDLIAVSNSADFAHLFQLWFQDEEGTIRMVGYNLRTNEFQPDIRAFPRN